MEITDHHVALSSEDQKGLSKPSIDHLFTTAARAFGEGLVAVILTGLGSDGAMGARAAKAAGGTVIIQDPETAEYPAMPLALPPGTVDIVSTIDGMGRLLLDLVTGTFPNQQGDEERLLVTFLEQLREQSGVDFASYKRPTIERRLQRRMAATGTSKLRDYIRYVSRNPDEYQRLVSSFLIKVTEFFRDPELFDHLRTEIVPELIAEGRRHGQELRLWSAGCATGEEAYSLAILIADQLRRQAQQIRRSGSSRPTSTPTPSLYARRGNLPAART